MAWHRALGVLILKKIWKFECPKHVSFICDKCGRCCGDSKNRVRQILLLKTDADRISKETLISVEEFAEEVTGFWPYTYRMKKTENRKCVFLKDNLCSIYERRPLVCRFYPFQLKNLRNNKYSFSYTSSCTGIGYGSQLRRPFFESLFSEFMDAMEENIENNS